jgi:hypothetical protein
MDSKCFDRVARTWATMSRRRVLAGLVSSLGATLPLALGAGVADARKKRRRKRKRKGKSAESCPAGLVTCNGQCRLPAGATCNIHGECCSNYCFSGECYPTCLGKGCSQDADCCAGVLCAGSGTCGDCRPPAGSCSPSGATCCYSECNGSCLSRVGERCTTRFDCNAGQPCVAGQCTCPTQCCSKDDCGLIEECVDGKCQAETGD